MYVIASEIIQVSRDVFIINIIESMELLVPMNSIPPLLA